MASKDLKNIDKALGLESKPITQPVSALDTKVTLVSELTCPKCDHKKAEIMPTNACQWLYECDQCHTVLKPKPGDCCVYCSYGSMKCPPMQMNKTSGCVEEG